MGDIYVLKENGLAVKKKALILDLLYLELCLC